MGCPLWLLRQGSNRLKTPTGITVYIVKVDK
jgi:hypothetical protein